MEKKITEVEELFNTVVKGGYCIGCGACAVIAGSPIKIKFDPYKKFQATISSTQLDCINVPVSKVCPFSAKSKDEDEIASELFGKELIRHEKLGYIHSTYAGYVIGNEYRESGSSGGLGTWILVELYRQGAIDKVAHVRSIAPSPENSKLFQYQISCSVEEIRKGAKSKYYPVELSEVLKEIKEKPGRYAVVGLPCFIKSIRLLSQSDPILNERIKFCIGLVCGHLKSAHFASMLSWQVGIHPSKLISFDFRTKLKGYDANEYGITATGLVNGEEKNLVSPPINQVFGSNWGWGFFKYKACDYCDDVVAETADLTIGDAWLPKYVQDSGGTNVIIVRNKEINDVILNGQQSKVLNIEKIDPEDVVRSQQSGFSHRREGLAYRLYLLEKENIWYPKKRVGPSNKLPRCIKKRQKIRIALSEQSHSAFQRAQGLNSFDIFESEMAPLLKKYKKLYRTSLKDKVFAKVKRVFQ